MDRFRKNKNRKRKWQQEVMTWISKIKKYKGLDKRERKIYNSKLLASNNIFLACLCFFYFIFYFIRQDTLYIVEVINGFFMILVLAILKLRLTWRFSLVCFEVKIEFFLLQVIIVAFANLFIYFFLLLFINSKLLCLLKICHIDIKCSKFLLHLD